MEEEEGTDFMSGNSFANLKSTEEDKNQLGKHFAHPSPSPSTRSELNPLTSSCLPYSRDSSYRANFEEISNIGEGGFGTVVKARHRLDGREYAVKKVRFWNKNMELHLREVKALAQLNEHPNIVGYHTVWQEYSGCNSPQPSSQGSLSSQSQGSSEESSYDARRDARLHSEADDFSLVGVKRKFNIAVKLVDKNDEAEEQQADANNSSNLSLEEEEEEDGNSHVEDRVALTLYIQMELCTLSLDQWLKDRNVNLPGRLYVDEGMSSINNEVFRQIFDALTFIHSKQLMHRDLKPSNILFYGNKFQVKIADFGLVKELVQKHSKEVLRDAAPITEGKHTIGLGTPPYVSPEQLNGSVYNEKTDLFSVGIMLYEVYHLWDSLTEKSYACDDLKKRNKCSEEFRKEWPELATIVEDLIHPNPAIRPSAVDMLGHQLFLSEERRRQLEIETLRKQVALFKAAGANPGI